MSEDEKKTLGSAVRAIVLLALTRPPRCVQKRSRISHAKLKPPFFASASTLDSPTPTPLPIHPPHARIDGPRKRSHLNANNDALIAIRAATRGRSHTIESPSISLPALVLPHPQPVSAISHSHPHVFSAPSLCSPLFFTMPLFLPRNDLCPRAVSFRDIIAPHRGPDFALVPRNGRRRAATTYGDYRDAGGSLARGTT